MKWQSYIPVANDSLWQVRFCTLGNWDLYDNAPRIYTREPVLLQIELKDVSSSEEIQLSFANTDIPTATYLAPEPDANGKATLIVDLTDYVKANCDAITVLYVSEDTSVTVYVPTQTSRRVNGVPAHSLMLSQKEVAHAEEGYFPLGIDEAICYLFGSLPSKATRGDVVEVMIPKNPNTKGMTYAQWSQMYNNIVNPNPEPDLGYAMFETWRIGKAGLELDETPVAQGCSADNGDIDVFTVPSKTAYAGDKLYLYGVLSELANNSDLYPTKPSGLQDTCIMVKVEDAHDDERHRRVTWRSRTGRLLSAEFEIIKTKEDAKDETQLQDVTGDYKCRKGYTRTITIRKEGLNAFDVWYYGAIALSDEVTIASEMYARLSENDPCKVLTKSVQANVSGNGEYYDVEFELQIGEYGAY